MRTLIELLDEAKIVSGSDYKTAERLGVRRQYLSDARKGKGFSVEKCRELAEIIKKSPLEIIAAAEVAKHPERKKDWSKWVAGFAITTVMILGNTTHTSKSYADSIVQPFIHYTHLASLRRAVNSRTKDRIKPGKFIRTGVTPFRPTSTSCYSSSPLSTDTGLLTR